MNLFSFSDIVANHVRKDLPIHLSNKFFPRQINRHLSPTARPVDQPQTHQNRFSQPLNQLGITSNLSMCVMRTCEKRRGLSPGPPTLESRPPRRGREPSGPADMKIGRSCLLVLVPLACAHYTPARFTSPP